MRLEKLLIYARILIEYIDNAKKAAKEVICRKMIIVNAENTKDYL